MPMVEVHVFQSGHSWQWRSGPSSHTCKMFKNLIVGTPPNAVVST